MEIKNFFAQDSQGNIMPSADCYLYLPDTTNLATGLVDADGLPISNPFKASLIGQVQFGAPNGVYDLRIARGTRDTTIRIQCADLLQSINEIGAFLGPHATAPTTRNDGSPLQLADRYLNTTDQNEYIYKASGWVNNNVDSELLATSEGASLIGAVMQDGSVGTVQQAIDEGDNSLRQDLARPDGAQLVGGASVVCANHAALLAIPTTATSQWAVVQTPDYISFYGWFLGDSGTVADGYIIAKPNNGPGFWRLNSGKKINVMQLGAQSNGTTDDHLAVQSATDNFEQVEFPSGRTTYIGAKVTVTTTTEFVGTNATVKSLNNNNDFVGRTFEINGPGVKFKGINFDANGCAYVILTIAYATTIEKCVFYNTCLNYIFALSGCSDLSVISNRFKCEDAESINTCVSLQTVSGFRIFDNDFIQVPVGWSVRASDGSYEGAINSNRFVQNPAGDTATATAGQTVFTFTLSRKVFFTGVQINGRPVTRGFTVTQSGNTYTVTFEKAFTSAALITFLGYRGAENIQVNVNSYDIEIDGNIIDGTGDSGMTLLSDRLTVTNNMVKNAAHAGIAFYGDTNQCICTGNSVIDCSQLDDGGPFAAEGPANSVFNGGILLSGRELTVANNSLINNGNTMQYGIRVNTVSNRSDGSADATIQLGVNNFSGEFLLGKVFMPSGSALERIEDVSIEGTGSMSYPAVADFDTAFPTGAPATPVNTPYIGWAGFGATVSSRDTAVKLYGLASMKTYPGEYVELLTLASGMFKDTIVEIEVWAISTGVGYFGLLSTVGAEAVSRVTVDSGVWKQYTLRVAISDGVTAVRGIRFGSDTGNMNFMPPTIKTYRIPK